MEKAARSIGIHDRILDVTDAILPRLRAWQQRPPEVVDPVMYLEQWDDGRRTSAESLVSAAESRPGGFEWARLSVLWAGSVGLFVAFGSVCVCTRLGVFVSDVFSSRIVRLLAGRRGRGGPGAPRRRPRST